MIAIAIARDDPAEPDDLRALRLRRPAATRRPPGSAASGSTRIRVATFALSGTAAATGRGPRRVAGPQRPGDQRPVPDVHGPDRDHRRRHQHPRRRGLHAAGPCSAACSWRSSRTGSTCSGSTRSTSRSRSVSSCSWPSASTPGRDGSSSGSQRGMHHHRPDRLVVRRHPAPDSAISSGVARVRIVGPEQGAVHTDLAVAVIQPGGWLAPARPQLRGVALHPRGRAAARARRHGPSPDRRRLLPDADRLPARARQQQRRADPDAVALVADAARSRRRSQGHVLRAGPGPRRDGARPRSARRSATRRSGSSATTTARGPQLETLRDQGRGARPRLGRARHRAGRLQRHLREDARRPRSSAPTT